MDDKKSLKLSVCSAIDSVSSAITDIGDDILAHPELGFREERTAAIVADYLRSLGLEVRTGLAVTGVKATIKGSKPGPNVAIIGELDSVMCIAHPHADKTTGAAHACGHNAQIAYLLAAAAGLVKSGAADNMCGSVTIFAVPAEECIDYEYRRVLVDSGKIVLPYGKPELIRMGEFDDVDMAMMLHANPANHSAGFNVGITSLGFISKEVEFFGKASHAGAAPHEGVNALNAAMLAMMGFHVNRETFRDSDKVRVHPIIVDGGEVINTVPDHVRMDLQVRAASIPAMQDAAAKIDRSIEGACMTVGAKCRIDTTPGYLPLMESAALNDAFADTVTELFGEGYAIREDVEFGSTDMGDLSQIMPAIHSMYGGFSGGLHRPNFSITDKAAAYIYPAKALAATALGLLLDDAAGAGRVLESYVPGLTKEEYLRIVTAKQ